MKIFMISHALSYGGAERVGVSWANGLVELGVEVFFYADFTQCKTYQLNDKVRRIQSLTMASSVFGKIKRHVSTYFNLVDLFDEIKPDAIILVSYIMVPVVCLAARKCGCKVIITDHNSFERPKDAPMSIKVKIWKNLYTRLADVVTVLTDVDKAICVRKKIRCVETLHNPLFLRPVVCVPAKEKIILSAGRMDVWHCKGFDLLIEAWNGIAHKFPDWRLRLVGKGSEKSLAFLKSLVAPSVPVDFVDYTPDILQEYKRAAVYVLASRYEGWGLVMIEAMSQGCATIACNYNGRQSEAIVDGHNGLLCPVGDSDAIRKRLELLLTNNEKRVQLQHEAIKDLELYSEITVARNLLSIIKKYFNGTIS